MTVDVAAARQLADAATPGPWTADKYGNGAYFVGQVPGGRPNGEVIGDLNPSVPNMPGYPLSAQHANADFIAWCRLGVPALLDDLVRVSGELANTQAALGAIVALVDRHFPGPVSSQDLARVLPLCAGCGFKVNTVNHKRVCIEGKTRA